MHYVAAFLAILALAVVFILYREMRNQHHMWHDECITPSEVRDDLRRVLHAFRVAAEGTGLRWWLDYGTLLGAWRIGDVMPHDHDLDLSMRVEDLPLLERLRPRLAEQGIELRMERTSIFYRGRKIGDLETWTDYGGLLRREDPRSRELPLAFQRFFVDDFPPAWVEPLWSIQLDGAMFPCPNHPERLLRRRYVTARLHLRLVYPHKIRCWTSREFWREARRMCRFRGAPVISRHGPSA
jgi:hypothetical protein